MRFSWRAENNGNAVAQPDSIPASPPAAPASAAQQGGAMDLTGRAVSQPANDDLSAQSLGRVLWKRRRAILVPTVLAALVAAVAVNLMTPRYKSEARILIEPRENAFLRPDVDKADRSPADADQVASHVQIALSRELAMEVIRQAKLVERWEFAGVSSVTRNMLGAVGLGKDPARSAEERVLEAYYDHLSVYPVERSRVIAVEFQSSDAELAAKVSNLIADAYLQYQQAARQNQAQSAGKWLSTELDSLRKKVADAEGRVEDFRARANLFSGSGNTSLAAQQLSDLSTQLSNARAQKAESEAKARTIREMIKNGRNVEISDFLNSELLRRLIEQRIVLRAQLAEQSSTLLDGHPRIRELRAQINDLDRQIRDEGDRLARASENDAKISAARMESINATLDSLKKQSATNSPQDVQLRALEREAKSQRDLLESYLAKYREASARESIDAAPPDARIISRAVIANTPSFPKKIPTIIVAALAALVLSAALVLTNALMNMTPSAPPRREMEWASASASPVVSVAPPANSATRVEPQMASATVSAAAQVAAPPPVMAQSAPHVAQAPAAVESAMQPGYGLGLRADSVSAAAARHALAPQWTGMAESAPEASPFKNAPSMAAPAMTSPAMTSPAMPTPGLAQPVLAATPMQLAESIAQDGRGHRLAVFSAQRQPDGGAAALALARALATNRRVILIDCAAGASLIRNEMLDPATPGLWDLAANVATIAGVMTRDRASALHMVGAGRPQQVPPDVLAARIALLVDALARTYDHIVLNMPAQALLATGDVARLATEAVIAVEGRAADAEPLAAMLMQNGFLHAQAMDAPFGRLSQSAA